MTKERSNGATASYYELPAGATQLQDLISDRDMNSQIGEIFRACYRYGRVSHSDKLRDARKILFYAQAEVKRLEMLAEESLSAEPAPFTAANIGIITDQSTGRDCRTCSASESAVGTLAACLSCNPVSLSNWRPR